MPPTLRSAQSSPAGKVTPLDVSPNITPGRKVPRCSKCSQPRLGHPRSGCPFTDSPTKDADTSPIKPKSRTLQDNISRAFSSMYLEESPAPAERMERKGPHNQRPIGAPALQTSETLASISSSAENILGDLMKPAFFSQETVNDNDGKGSKEQDGPAHAPTPSKVRIKSGPQRLMPGTLMAPSWESSIGKLSDDVESSEGRKNRSTLAKSSLGVQTSFSDSAPSPLHSQLSTSPSPASASPRPLQRSQTQERREMFLSSLSQTSPASVYIHKKQEIDSVHASAEAAKLHIRVINSEEDGEEEDVLVVIGSDLRAVEKLTDELMKSIKDRLAGTTTTINNFYVAKPTEDRPETSSSTMKAVASGAIVGVVGAWAGLAFS